MHVVLQVWWEALGPGLLPPPLLKSGPGRRAQITTSLISNEAIRSFNTSIKQHLQCTKQRHLYTMCQKNDPEVRTEVFKVILHPAISRNTRPASGCRV